MLVFKIFRIPGNRWLRGQKPEESEILTEIDYPSRRDKDSWQFFKILECCNHFLGQGQSKMASANSAVTLITTNRQETATNDRIAVANSKGKEP